MTGDWRLGTCRVAIAALASALLAGPPAQAQQPSAPTYGGTLVIAGGSDLQHMNSLVNADLWTGEFINHVLFLPLLRFNADLSYAPALAQSWRMLGDTGVVFHLRRDVFWHDGARTSAYDVAFTFERAKDEATAFANTEYFDKWQRAEVIDSFTIRFSFDDHVDPLIGWALTAVMPGHLLDTVPGERMRQAAFNKSPVGNGPFRFVSQRANDRWVFEANTNFPRALGGAPYIDRLIWRVIPDNTAQATEIVAGQADLITGARAEQVKQLAARPDLTALFKPNTRYAMIPWNGKRPPLNDERVRRALTMALNRQEMIDVLRGGYAQVATSPVPPFHWAYDRALAPLPYDTAAARLLLKEAGWLDRNDDGVLDNAAGKPLEIELKIAANNAFNRDIGELVRAHLQRVGVKVNVRPVDFAVMIEDLTSPERNFDGAFLMFGTDFRLSFRDAFHSEALAGPFQSASYSNPAMDRLLDQVAVTKDRAAATAHWHKIQRILRDDQPWTFLWWSPDMLVIRDRVRGVEVDVRGALASLPRWWLDEN